MAYLSLWRGPQHDFPGAGAFVIIVLAVIVLIFLRVYVWGGRSKGPSGHRSRRRTEHRDTSHQPERHDGNHGHQAGSRQRPSQPPGSHRKHGSR
jgi:hypothetical protein